MDRIVLSGLEFHGYHGVFEEEARLGACSVVVRVHKPHAPLPGIVRDVLVEVHRERA